MKLYAPKYYKKFKCIADKCEHSCCIGWEIDVDETALDKYKSLKGSFAEDILNSISYDPTPHFKLCAGERCPHLDKNGLCKIILSAGEDFLCDICHEHPRFYNYTGVAEVGIGMSCREAARVILSSDDFDELEEIGVIADALDEISFDGRADRQKIYEILKKDNVSYRAKLQSICREYKINRRDDSEYSEIINSLEYLDDSHRELFGNYSSESCATEADEYLVRALAYFVYRHCTEAFDADDFRARLSFCLFCVGLLESLVASQGAKTLNETAFLASLISEEIEYSEENTEALTY